MALMRLFLIPLAVLATASCASDTALRSAPALLFSGGSVQGGDSLPREIPDVELAKVATRFEVPQSVLTSRSHWWLIVGEMKTTGGWTWTFVSDPDEYPLSLCLKAPGSDTAVTMAFTAPTGFIGSNNSKSPIVVSSCAN